MRLPLVLLLLAAVPFSATAAEEGDAVVSSAPAHKVLPAIALSYGSPFSLEFLQDRRGSHVQLFYRMAWDMHDIRKLPWRTTKMLLNPMDTLYQTGRDLTLGANIGIYGLSIRPSRMVRFESTAQRRTSRPSGSGEADAQRAANPPESTRRIRLSLTPVIEDIRRDLGRSLQRQILIEGFDAAMPAYQQASYGQKRAVTDDAMRTLDGLGIHTPDAPGLPLGN
ncbi:MAG: hypothetical protein ABIJ96_06340 [Elusimicrobiota bacterium]